MKLHGSHRLFVTLTLAALIGAPLCVLAQEGAPVLDEDQSLGVSMEFSGTIAGETEQRSGKGQSGDVSTEQVAVGLSQVVADRLTVGANFAATSLHAGSHPTVPLPDWLRSVEASFMYRHPLNSSWTGLVFLNPGWHTASDAGWLASKGFGVTAGVGARHQYSPTLAYSFGVAFNSLARSSLRVLPVLGLEWQPAPDWSVALGFPRTEVLYSVTKQLRLGLAAEGIGGTYYVEKDPLPKQTGRPALRNTRLEFYEVRTGIKLAYALSRTSSLSVTGGWVLDRRFDYHSAHYKLESHGTAPYGAVAANIAF